MSDLARQKEPSLLAEKMVWMDTPFATELGRRVDMPYSFNITFA
jgi:hypothetical protein